LLWTGPYNLQTPTDYRQERTFRVLDVLGADPREVGPRRGVDPESRLDADVRVREFGHARRCRGLVEDVVVVLGLPDDDPLGVVGVVLVTDTEGERDAELVPRRGVDDGRVRRLRVRNRHEPAVERPDAGDAEADVLDAALPVVPLHPVTDAGLRVGDEEDAGDGVADDVLRGEADG
jgi:hypothetical protein